LSLCSATAQSKSNVPASLFQTTGKKGGTLTLSLCLLAVTAALSLCSATAQSKSNVPASLFQTTGKKGGTLTLSL
ncbi:hypothetical protein CTI14_70485, partial [Methylobacterium radiotolerans]